jgi:hypothetical protein
MDDQTTPCFDHGKYDTVYALHLHHPYVWNFRRMIWMKDNQVYLYDIYYIILYIIICISYFQSVYQSDSQHVHMQTYM